MTKLNVSADARVVELTQALIRCPSVTSDRNEQVTQLVCDQLDELGFEVSTFAYADLQPVDKLSVIARRMPAARSSSSPSLQRPVAFFGHSDVVAVDGWDQQYGGPFDGKIQSDKLFGRGACDMKGPIAAALTAIRNVDVQEQSAPIYFFVTGDEECGMRGAELIASESSFYRDLVAAEGVGIITEPTQNQLVNAHKGGCRIQVVSEGVAAHSSTKDGLNANWQLIPFLNYLNEIRSRLEQDSTLRNTEFDPADMSLNVILENHPAMANITVGQAIVEIFFRPMPDTAWRELAEEIVARAHSESLSAVMTRPMPPMHTPTSNTIVQACLDVLEQSAPLAVSYATDGCCLEELQDKLVLGPGSIEQAHRRDEYVALEQLQAGVSAYLSLLKHFACL